MSTYARVVSGVVFETITLPNGISPDQALDASLAADCHPCADNVGQGWTFSAGVFAAPIPVTPSIADLTAFAASRRYALETGGYTFEGHPIATDRDSQSKIGNVALAANLTGSSFTTRWKGSDGVFFNLDQAGTLAIATAVMNFVNACFAAEASIVAEILAGTINTIPQIDAATWPANS